MKLPSTRKCPSSSVSSPGLRHLAPSRVSSLTTNQGLTFQFLTFPPRTLLLAYKCQEPIRQLQSHVTLSYINSHPDSLSQGDVQDSHGEQRACGTAWARVGVTWSALGFDLFPPSPALWVLRITLTSGCLTLQRAAYFLFYLSISRFVISIKYFLFNPLASLYPLIKKKILKLIFLS